MTNQEAIEFLKNMIDREAIGFVCPKGEGDVSVWQYHVEALQIAISALQEQEVKQEAKHSTESSETQNALDTISRQAAIDAILAVTGNSSVRELYEHVQEHGLSDMWSGGVNAAIDIIIAVPSAQPKPCEDAVSRADVLESFADLYDTFEDCSKGIINELHRKFEDLRTLPSVTLKAEQPEIIYCKDCKHYKAYEYTGRLACHYVIGGTVVRKPDDFCSRAERITE